MVKVKGGVRKVKHLTKADISSLNFHQEFGGILDADKEREITLHLDNCPQCRERFFFDKYGIVQDKREEIREDIVRRSVNIAYSVFSRGISDMPSVFRLIEKNYPDFIELLEKYKCLGGDFNELFLSVEGIVK